MSCLKEKKIDRILFVFLVVATIFRIILQMKLLLYIQADSKYDDYMMVGYANSLLAGQWLGTFNHLTLVKSVSYSVYLAINFLLGIPYSLALILFYIFAIFLLVKVLGEHIKNFYMESVLYLFLLYSPVMFHEENVQKIYRGGVLVCATITVLASFIGIFNVREKSLKKMLSYSLLASVALPFFYYVKEDSIWIVPFCVGAAVVTVIAMILNKRDKIKELVCRGLVVILPFMALALVNVGYCSLNKHYYGAYTITDRSGTYFKEFMTDLIQIDDGETDISSDIWLSKKAVYLAMDASPSFGLFRENFDNLMKDEGFGRTAEGFNGDFYIWNLRNMFQSLGFYEKDMRSADYLYSNIHRELTAAFEDGRLQKKPGIYLSCGMKGLRWEDMGWLIDNFRSRMKVLCTYSEHALSMNYAKGAEKRILEMSFLTNSPVLWPETDITDNVEIKIEKKFMDIANKIVRCYQITGKAALIAGFLGLIVMTGMVIGDAIKKSYSLLAFWLILMGMLAVGGINFIAVEWFTSFLSLRKFYDYICCAIPIMQVLEFAGIYAIGVGIVRGIEKFGVSKTAGGK